MTGANLRRQFIRHNPTGQIWAVETLDGAVRGVVGPLGRIDVDPVLLEYLGYDRRDVTWMTLHAAEFTQMDGQAFDVPLAPRKALAKAKATSVREDRQTAHG